MILLDFATPDWFVLPQIFIYFVFFLVTFLVARYSYKAYVLTRQKLTAIFGIAFSMLSFGYLLQAVLQWMIYTRADHNQIIKTTINAVQSLFSHPITLSYFATVIHMVVLLTALVMLSYVTFKERSKKVFLLILVDLFKIY